MPLGSNIGPVNHNDSVSKWSVLYAVSMSSMGITTWCNSADYLPDMARADSDEFSQGNLAWTGICSCEMETSKWNGSLVCIVIMMMIVNDYDDAQWGGKGRGNPPIPP